MLVRGKRGPDDAGSARPAGSSWPRGEVIGPDGRRALRLSVGAQIRTVPGA